MPGAAGATASRPTPLSALFLSGEREPLRLRDTRHIAGLAPEAQSLPAAPGVLPGRNVSAPNRSPAAAEATPAAPADSLARSVEGRPGAAADVAGRVVPRCDGVVMLSTTGRSTASLVLVVASLIALPLWRSVGALTALPWVMEAIDGRNTTCPSVQSLCWVREKRDGRGRGMGKLSRLIPQLL